MFKLVCFVGLYWAACFALVYLLLGPGDGWPPPYAIFPS